MFLQVQESWFVHIHWHEGESFTFMSTISGSVQNLGGSSDRAPRFDSISDARGQGKGKRKDPARGDFSAPPAPCEVPETSQAALSGDVFCPPYVWLVPSCTHSSTCASAAPRHRAGERGSSRQRAGVKPPGKTSSLDPGTPRLLTTGMYSFSYKETPGPFHAGQRNSPLQ